MLVVVKRYSSDVVVAASIVAADFARLFESRKAMVEDDISEFVKIRLDAHGIDMETSVTGSNTVKNHRIASSRGYILLCSSSTYTDEAFGDKQEQR
uniref:40S ribosomal protein S13 n=1 Tax=Tanacetum cinerariifolium TaxID=118510 RepID=A0A699HEX3_TANCI|nr:40S ribosomal protein S13 [Tanacetum cinerariifolium]